MSEDEFVATVQRIQSFISEGACRMITGDLLNIQESLYPLLKEWLRTGVLPDSEPIHGKKAQGLRAGEYGYRPLKPTAVLLMLDQLLTDPIEANRVLTTNKRLPSDPRLI
jgi:hypothetical protein